MLDGKAFDQALARAGAARPKNGIGTLGEKTLHNVLKYYCEPDDRWHEVRVGDYVADIIGGDGVIEIQTGGFSAFRPKLAYLLSRGAVTVVYPAAHDKWLCWVDPVTGEVTKRRKSPKTGNAFSVFHELVYILPLLHAPGLTLRILMIDLEETRFLDGWSADRKKGSHRCDRYPLGLADQTILRGAADYAAMIPPQTPARFTAADLGAAAKLTPGRAREALRVMREVGAVECVGKTGRRALYERADFTKARAKPE